MSSTRRSARADGARGPPHAAHGAGPRWADVGSRSRQHERWEVSGALWTPPQHSSSKVRMKARRSSIPPETNPSISGTGQTPQRRPESPTHAKTVARKDAERSASPGRGWPPGAGAVGVARAAPRRPKAMGGATRRGPRRRRPRGWAPQEPGRSCRPPSKIPRQSSSSGCVRPCHLGYSSTSRSKSFKTRAAMKSPRSVSDSGFW